MRNEFVCLGGRWKWSGALSVLSRKNIILWTRRAPNAGAWFPTDYFYCPITSRRAAEHSAVSSGELVRSWGKVGLAERRNMHAMRRQSVDRYSRRIAAAGGRGRGELVYPPPSPTNQNVTKTKRNICSIYCVFWWPCRVIKSGCEWKRKALFVCVARLFILEFSTSKKIIMADGIWYVCVAAPEAPLQ